MATTTNSSKVIPFPTSPRLSRGKKGDVNAKIKKQHVIRRRLDEMGKSVKWLADEMHVSTSALYDHMNHKHRLRGINFATMLRVLGLNLDQYHGTGRYAKTRRIDFD